MMPNAIGSNVGATNPPRRHANPPGPKYTGSTRLAGALVIAMPPRSMFDQTVARSGAPGNTAAMPTIAIGSRIDTRVTCDRRGRLIAASHERTWIRRAQDDLRISACALELGEQRRDAAIGIDQIDAALRVLALE